MDRTVILSLTPSIPGLRVHIPRTMRSILTPLQEASYNLAMISLSSKEFIFAMICPPLPCSTARISPSIKSIKDDRKVNGATIRCCHCCDSAYPEMVLKNRELSSA